MQHAREKHVEVTFQQFESPQQENMIKRLQTQLGQTPRLIGRVFIGLEDLPKHEEERKTRVPLQLVGSLEYFQGEPHL